MERCYEEAYRKLSPEVVDILRQNEKQSGFNLAKNLYRGDNHDGG